VTALRRAIAAWAKLPKRARREAVELCCGEANQSRESARDEVDGRVATRRHEQDAAAFEAAAKLLRAAGKPAEKAGRAR